MPNLDLPRPAPFLGRVFGPFLDLWLCDAIGRKRMVLINAALLVISAIFSAIPDFLGSSEESVGGTKVIG